MRPWSVLIFTFALSHTACTAPQAGEIRTITEPDLSLTVERPTGLVNGQAGPSWAIENVVLKACGPNSLATDFNIIPSGDGSGAYAFGFRCA